MGSQVQAIRVLLLVASAADPPVADTLGVLAVAPPPGPGPQLVEIAVDLRRSVAESHASVLDARALRDRMTGRAAGTALPEVDRALEGARAAWVAGEYDRALRTLRGVVLELEQLPEAPDVFERWTRAMLRLARSEMSLGDEVGARATVERLVRAAPDVPADPGVHGARLATLVEAARVARTKAPSSALAVTTSTPGARVYVDGRDVGPAPLVVSLPRGSHRASASSGGLRVGPVPVELGDADGKLTLDFSLVAALRPSAGPGLALPDAERARGIVAAGAHLGLDRVLAVGLVEDGGAPHVMGALYDVARGTLEREGRVRLVNGSVPPGGHSALAGFLVSGFPSVLVEVSGARPVPDLAIAQAAPPADVVLDGAPAEKQLSSSPRGWAVAAAGVVAIGLATYGLVEVGSAASSYDEARALRSGGGVGTVPGIERYNAAVADGDAASRRGTAAFVAAGAAVLVTGVVGWIHYRKSGELGPIRF